MPLGRIESLRSRGTWLTDDRLISRRVSTLFLLSTILVVASVPLAEGWVDITKMSFWMRLPLTILAMFSAIAILFLWVGMWRYWIRLDDSSVWVKRVWFVILLVGFWYGSVPYYFLVYRPQVIRRAEGGT